MNLDPDSQNFHQDPKLEKVVLQQTQKIGELYNDFDCLKNLLEQKNYKSDLRWNDKPNCT
jgi:hypothetical protein